MMVRCMIWLPLLVLVMSAATLSVRAEMPSWTATEDDYLTALTLNKRLTPEGAVDYQVPEGFRAFSDMAGSGFGSFQIAVPDAWSAWTIGMGVSGQTILPVFKAADPVLAETIEHMLRNNVQSGSPRLRGLFAVADGDEVAFIEVSVLGQLGEDVLEIFHQKPEFFYNRLHGGGLQTLTWFEHHRSRSLRTTSSDAEHALRVIDYFIVEQANRVLWDLRCLFPKARGEGYQELCDDIVETFAAGAFIKGAGN